MDDPVGILAEGGWQASVTQAGAEDANHGRWQYPMIRIEPTAMPHVWFVTAHYRGHA